MQICVPKLRIPLESYVSRFSGPFDRKDTMAGAFAVALTYELILSHLIGWKTCIYSKKKVSLMKSIVSGTKACKI